MKKHCPKCHQEFNCKVEELETCQCSEVKLSQATLEFLQKTNFDCLCNNCLKEYEQLTQSVKDLSFPTKSTELIEGTHYYLENGLFVFTEKYHYLRGYCCENGCKHCVYGFKKNK